MFQPLDRGSKDRANQWCKAHRPDRGKPYLLRRSCPYAQAPKDNELLRYALEWDSLAYSVKKHIIQCKSCRQQVEGLISTNSSLVRKLYRSRCPDIDTLARYSADLASLSEGLLVFYHLQFCPLCTEELQDMKAILEDDIL
jgi:hypothetical protein